VSNSIIDFFTIVRDHYSDASHTGRNSYCADEGYVTTADEGYVTTP